MFKISPSKYESGNKVTCSEECSIKYRTDQKIFPGSESNEYIQINDDLRQIIDGELLGDGCIIKPKSCINSLFQYKTSNQEYSDYIKSKLLSFDPSHDYDHSQYIHLERATGISWYTKTNPSLTEIYNRWYPDDIKVVPRDIKLTPLTCLHWFLGDGCLSTNTKTQQQYIELHTQGFSVDDIDFLVSSLNSIGFKASRVKARLKKNSDEMTYKIAISPKSMTKFLKYIGECPVDSYKYKWKILDSTYYLYEDYIYSTGDIGKMLGRDAREINSMAKSDWFRRAGIDCVKMWSRLRFSEEGYQRLRKNLEYRGTIC